MSDIRLNRRNGRKTYSAWIEGHYVSTGQTDERLARVAARQMVTVGVDAWRRGKRSLSQKLSDLIEEHLAYLRDVDGRGPVHISKKRTKLMTPVETGQMRVLKDVTKSRVQAYLDGLTCGPKTRNEYQTAWNVFVDWLVYEGRLPENPIKGRIRRARVKESDKKKRRHFTVEELKSLLAVAGKRESLYLIAAVTGARRNELEQLTWSNVHERDEPPHVILRGETTKNGKSRRQFLNPEAVEALAQLRVIARTDQVFPTMPSHHTIDKDLAAAGIEKHTPDGVACFHSLRHSFATLSARVSKDPRVTQRMADHSDLKTTQRYMHTEADEVYAVVQGFPQLRATECATPVFNRSQNESNVVELRPAESEAQVPANDSDSHGLSNHVEHGHGMEPGGIEPNEIPGSRHQGTGFPAERATKCATYATPEFAAVVEAWPDLPQDARSALAKFVKQSIAAKEPVGESSSTAGPDHGHGFPPSVRQELADGGNPNASTTEPVEGSRRHGNAVPTGFAVGTRLPAESDSGAGGEAAGGVR